MATDKTTYWLDIADYDLDRLLTKQNRCSNG